jgi:hypothetical protein
MSGSVRETEHPFLAPSRHRRLRDPFGRGETEFPVIPVETGIFSIAPRKCRFGTKKAKADRALAKQFPSPAKRELIGG